jgi:DNA-directed RNA polymerase specialized sigma subunit|nr:MAG TPA: Protein of unknown function (DUF1492) [Caudoviricetes sp.]
MLSEWCGAGIAGSSKHTVAGWLPADMTISAPTANGRTVKPMEAEKDNSAKRYLQQIRRLDMKINRDIEELHRLKAMVTKITPTLKQDVVSGGGSQDKLSDAVAKIVDLEAEINQEIDRLVDARAAVTATIDRVEDARLHTVLNMRYVQFKTWEQIACYMGRSYQWVCKLHGTALQAVEKIIKISEENDIS